MTPLESIQSKIANAKDPYPPIEVTKEEMEAFRSAPNPECTCSGCVMLRSTICPETTRLDWPEPAMFFFKRVDVGRYELAIDKGEYDILIDRERETEDEVVIELIAKPNANS